MFDSEETNKKPLKHPTSLPDGFWLVAIWQVFLQQWRLILGSTGVGLATVVILGFLMPPVHEVKLVMVPVDADRISKLTL